jgi:hypothetical protein
MKQRIASLLATVCLLVATGFALRGKCYTPTLAKGMDMGIVKRSGTMGPGAGEWR